ncbi:MAG: transglutaminase family protein [Desulfobacteraceae bacterium]|nr:transglutaminase family protein [Desulfobacteraceae bacterium]
MMKLDRYLGQTDLLDFSHPRLTTLVETRNWQALSEYDKIFAAYDFVQNEILFGYNRSDEIPASKVLKDGYGQCNTKGTLFMALLRHLKIACRFHGFTIDKALQKGAIPAPLFLIAPKKILHSWVEILFQKKWINLEGFILDRSYLDSVQKAFPDKEKKFCGYGIATTNFKSPPIEWMGNHTYIQKEGISQDFGLFDDPDQFYATHGSNLRGIKKFAYKYLIRHLINLNVKKIRKGRHRPKPIHQ